MCDSGVISRASGQADTSRASPLQIPEIVNLIFCQMDGAPQTLYRSALVCKQWSAAALEALWRDNTPDISVLGEMHSKGALAKYVPLMQNIRLSCMECQRGNFRGEACPNEAGHQFVKTLGDIFPQLKVVTLDVRVWFQKATEEYIGSLIQRHLRRLIFLDTRAQIEMLEVLTRKSPMLETLDMELRFGDGIRYDDIFCAFLSEHPKLRKIKSISQMSNPAVQRLAKLCDLEELYVTDFHSADWLDVLLESNGGTQPLWPALRKLDIGRWNVSTAMVARLLSAGLFPSLQYLKTWPRVPEEGSEVFSSLANSPCLVSVQLSICVDLSESNGRLDKRLVDPADVLTCFRGCQRLRRFVVSLCGANYSPVDSLSVSGEELCDALAFLPRIEELSMPWSLALGVHELCTLRDCCPRMKSLYLKGATLCYGELLTHPNPPVLPGVKTILDAHDNRRAPWEPLSLPHDKSIPLWATPGQRAEAFCRVFPSVFKIYNSPPTPDLEQVPWL